MLYVEDDKIMDMKSNGISRRNFAKKLVTEPERSTCNVNRRNKPKLDPIRSAYMYVKTFQMHPQVEKLDKAWRHCTCNVIDEGLNRKGKGNFNS